MLKLATLGAVMNEIGGDMRRVWRRQMQLPDNLPVLVEFRATRMPEDKRTKIENEVGLEKTKWLDTHPCAADRIRRARLLGVPGLVNSEASARTLFENFDSVSKLVTLAFYEDDLNVPATPEFLIPLEQLLREQTVPKPTPLPAPAVPMMAYDPSRFRKPSGEENKQ